MWCKKNNLLRIIGVISLIFGFLFLHFLMSANITFAEEKEKNTNVEGHDYLYLADDLEASDNPDESKDNTEAPPFVDPDNSYIDIEEINISVNPPEVGKPIVFNLSGYSSKPENAFNDFHVYWYYIKEGKKPQILWSGSFQTGETYMVAVKAEFDKKKFHVDRSKIVLRVNGQPADMTYSEIDYYRGFIGIAYIWDPLENANSGTTVNDPDNTTGELSGDNLSPATGMIESNYALPIALGCAGLAIIACLLLYSLRKKQSTVSPKVQYKDLGEGR